MESVGIREVLEAYIAGLWAHVPFFSWFEVPIGMTWVDTLRKPWAEKAKDWARPKAERWAPFAIYAWRAFRSHRWASVIAVFMVSFTWANIGAFSEIYTSQKETARKLNAANDTAGVFVRRTLPSDAYDKAKESIKDKQALKSTVIELGSSRDNQSGDFAETLQRLFLHAGVRASNTGIATQKPDQTGIILFEFDPQKPSLAATQMSKFLSDVGVEFHVMKWKDHEGWNESTDFQLYVTRDEPARP